MELMQLLTENKDKVSSYCSLLDSIELEQAYCKQRIKEVEKYVERKEKTKEWLLTTAKFIIESTGCDLVGYYGNKIYLKKSTVVEVDDIKKIPAVYLNVKIETTANKNVLKADLKSGVVIPGATLLEKYNPTWK